MRRIFFRQIERFGNAAAQNVERLLLKSIHRPRFSTGVDTPFPLIDRVQQRTAIFQSLRGQIQPQVLGKPSNT